MKTIALFGSTGSVGRSTLQVIEHHNDDFHVEVLTAFQNVELLAKQAIQFKASHVVIGDPSLYRSLKDLLSGTDISHAAGEEAVIEAASICVDITIAAIVGMAGLRPLMKSLEHGKNVAIANKEPLVAAGPFVLERAKKYKTQILPIDSEHNAVFQLLENHNKSVLEKLILTASGGPFRTWSLEEMAVAKPAQALKHPNWDMGPKISIDSATMMNKALEVIEAQRLFDVPIEKIDVLIHPQSLIHSMVQYKDGSILAQMAASDMCTPIGYALHWPERKETPGKVLDFSMIKSLSFEAPNIKQFPFLSKARECLQEGLSSCVCLNAANEIAVEAFLDEKIAFLDIYKIVSAMLDSNDSQSLKSLSDVLSYDKLVRQDTAAIVNNFAYKTRVSS